MPTKTPTLRQIVRPIVVVMLCGVALAACDFGGPSPAAAFGGFGFGHMGGGFGGGGMGRSMGGGMGRSSRSFATAPRRGPGRIVERPTGGNKGGTGTGYDGGRGRHPVIGRGIGGAPIPTVSIHRRRAAAAATTVAAAVVAARPAACRHPASGASFQTK